MFIFGTKNEVKDLGNESVMPCPVCEKDRPFRLVLTYKLSHIYYIFGSVSHKAYHQLCTICSRGETLDTKKTEAALPRHPIPFMQRYGGYVLILLFFTIVALFRGNKE